MEENTPNNMNNNNIYNNNTNTATSWMNHTSRVNQPGSGNSRTNVSAAPVTAMATGPPPTPVVTYPWPANTNNNTASNSTSTTTTNGGFHSGVLQHQALQVNAGSTPHHGQPGFLVPNVNQLPMPASIGIPLYSTQPQSNAATPAAATPAAATPAAPEAATGKRKEHPEGPASYPDSKHAKIPANMPYNNNRMMNMIMNISMEPSVVSSYSSSDTKNGSSTSASCAAGGNGSSGGQNSSSLQSLGDDDSNLNLMNVDVSTLTPAERRRYERNMREQQRSYRISQQIKQLRDCLEQNKIPFKPNKFSILVSVVEYIKQLQARSIMLDTEHARLLQTIAQTTDMVQNDKAPPLAGISASSDEEADTQIHAVPDIQSPGWLVQGLDYHTVFGHCPAALGVASLDGRVLSCNTAFEELLNVNREQILEQSMFMYIQNHQDIFEAMADLLKRSSAATETAQHQTQILYWCGYVISLQAKKLAFSITLTNTTNGDPKFFSLSAAETMEILT